MLTRCPDRSYNTVLIANKMSKQTILLCVVAVLSWSIVSAHVLVPPQGYSVGFTGVVRKGVQKYVCKSGAWTKTGASADVYGVNGPKLATYWSVYDTKTRSITYYWNIINSAGESYEGGQSISGLQASPVTSMQVDTSSMSEYLSIAKVHRGSGDGDLVAFVSLTGTRGGLPPRKELCTSDGATSGVPFSGKFTFYTVDLQPPQVPASMTPPGMFVQTVFLEGKMMYQFRGGKWDYIGFFATMANVAGGNYLGKCGTVKGGSLNWSFRGPNGFSITGYKSRSLQMSEEGCPWELVKITAHTGTVAPFGNYCAALIGATYGGNPPNIASKMEGMEYGSCFTGQGYLYSN